MKKTSELLSEVKNEVDKCKCTEIEKEKVSLLNQRLEDKDAIIKTKDEFITFGLKKLEIEEKKVIELEAIGNEFNNLKLEDVKNKQENKKLLSENITLREEILTFKTKEFDRSVRRRNANENELKRLRDAYEKFFKSRIGDEKDKVQKDLVDVIEGSIRGVLEEADIDFEDIQELFAKCKEIAKLKVDLEKTQLHQEERQAYMEMPPRSNSNY